MKIHEYQAKEILRAYGVPVPRGVAAFTVQEAVEAAQKLGGPVWVVKAQIHAGGRGKGGGVKVAKSIDDVPILALTFHSARYDHLTLRRLVAQVDDAVKQVPLVAETTIIGGARLLRNAPARWRRSSGICGAPEC